MDACWAHNAEVRALFWGVGVGAGGDCVSETFSMSKKKKKKEEDLQKTELLELKIVRAYILKHASWPRFM